MIARILRYSRADWRRLAPRLALFAVAVALFTWAFIELTGTKHPLQAVSVDALLPEFRKHTDFTPVSSRSVSLNKGGVLPEGEAYPSVTIAFRSDFQTESGRCDLTAFDCGTDTQAQATRDRIRAASTKGVYSSGRFLLIADAGGIIWLQRHSAVE